jgi:hypothetical protein
MKLYHKLLDRNIVVERKTNEQKTSMKLDYNDISSMGSTDTFSATHVAYTKACRQLICIKTTLINIPKNAKPSKDEPATLALKRRISKANRFKRAKNAHP